MENIFQFEQLKKIEQNLTKNSTKNDINLFFENLKGLQNLKVKNERFDCNWKNIGFIFYKTFNLNFLARDISCKYIL